MGSKFKDVSLPFGLHSYERIAAELTEDGIPTRCEPSIRHRYALIRVDAMPWDSLRGVLETALEIRFVDVGNGHSEIRKDANAAAVEESLFRKFSRRYIQTIEDAIQAGWDVYRRLEAGSNRRGVDLVSDAMDSIRSLPIGNPDRNALTVGINLKQESGHRFVYAELWNGIDFVKALRGPAPESFTAEEISGAAAPDNPIGLIMPPAMRAFGVQSPDGEPILAPVQIEQWHLDTRTFALTNDVVAITSLGENGFGRSTTAVVPDAIGFDCSWDDLYKGLAAQTEARARWKATDAWLGSDVAKQPVGSSGSAETASGIMERWSVDTKRPLIMEVLPNRDGLSESPGPEGKKRTVERLIRGHSEEAITPRLLRSQWTVEDIGGVTVLRDELRFLDHGVPFNPDAAILLRAARDKAPDNQNSPADLLAASALLTPEEHLESIDLDAYGELADFPFASAYLHLIQSEATAVRAFKQIGADKDLRFPLYGFPPDARRRFGKSLHQLALRTPTTWSTALWPDFDQLLKTASIVIRTEALEGRRQLTFQLTTPFLKSPKSGLCPVSLGPVAIPE